MHKELRTIFAASFSACIIMGLGQLVLILATLLALAGYVLAAAHPDSDPSITGIYINRHLIESDDMLVYAVYNIPYASLPDERVDELFIFRLIDTDGTTELGAIGAYPYVSSGYGYGVVSFYFGASDAPTWGENYYMRISEKASGFSEPQHWTFTVNSGDYSTQTTQAGNRDEMETRIESIVTTLEAAWGTSYDLLSNSDTGQVLSSQGEAYFRNAIYGLQAMVPGIFSVIVNDPDYENLATSWNGTQADTYEERFTESDPGTTAQLWADMFSVDFNLIAGIPLLIFCVLAIVASVKISDGSAWPGMMCCIAILIVGFAEGWIARGIVATMSLVCAFFLIGVGVRRLLPS